jgi:hypothetical protein
MPRLHCLAEQNSTIYQPAQDQPKGLNMTPTRAADDFVTIRARMEELRRAARPRSADDFTTIRTRMEELRREQAPGSAEAVTDVLISARP